MNGISPPLPTKLSQKSWADVGKMPRNTGLSKIDEETIVKEMKFRKKYTNFVRK